MATIRPADRNPKPAKPLTLDEKWDEDEEDLYLAPDGTYTTYHAGDEKNPDSEWYKNPPTFTLGQTTFSVLD